MSLTERQRQCFIHGKRNQIQNARMEYYERARRSKSIEGEMYWWTAVFHHALNSGGQNSTNLAANLVREMLTNAIERNNVVFYDYIDDIVYSADKDVSHHMQFLEDKEGITTSMVVENLNPQMHEQEFNTLIDFLMFLQDILEILEGDEIRALAYFLVKTKLDKYLDYIDYLTSHANFNNLIAIVEEMYKGLNRDNPIDKQKFIGGSRWFTTQAEENLRKKMRFVLSS